MTFEREGKIVIYGKGYMAVIDADTGRKICSAIDVNLRDDDQAWNFYKTFAEPEEE